MCTTRRDWSREYVCTTVPRCDPSIFLPSENNDSHPLPRTEDAARPCLTDNMTTAAPTFTAPLHRASWRRTSAVAPLLMTGGGGGGGGSSGDASAAPPVSSASSSSFEPHDTRESGFHPYALACSLLIAMIIYFPLREPRLDYLAGIWWVRVAFLVLLTLVACSASSSSSGAIWIILTAALLGVVYVLAMNVHATRHLPLVTTDGDDDDGGHHAPPSTPPIRPDAQIAQIRHQQYADLIQRCLHSKQRDSPMCQQLAALHRTVHTLHSQEDANATNDTMSDRPGSS